MAMDAVARKEYYYNNREKCLGYAKTYREKNREKCRAASRKWVKNNPERAREYSIKYREDNRIKKAYNEWNDTLIELGYSDLCR